MQPYFFPYPGYFALMRDVDVFVFFDDVQYIDRGWVNRNRILSGGIATWWTMPVQAASRDLPIASRRYLVRESRERLLRRLAAAYHDAPSRADTLSLIDRLIGSEDAPVADLNISTLVEVARLMGISPRYVRSSSLGNMGKHRGQDRIIAICHKLGADHYVNPRGGMTLYEGSAFEAARIQLHFQSFEPIRYFQGPGTQVENLSIIDALMFNGADATAALVKANAGRRVSVQEVVQ